MNETNIKYPNKLKEYRLKHNMKQREVAILLDVEESENRISRWENGIALPNVLNFLKLCKLYGIEPDEVYGN